MATPIELINIAVHAGGVIDARFPGLRSSDNEAWMAKVAYLSSISDARIGRKARSFGARVSPDTVGIKEHVNNSDNAPFYAVSIIRDNPPTNEWRNPPLDYGLISGQLWIKADPVDIGEDNPVTDLEVRITLLESWARNIGFKG